MKKSKTKTAEIKLIPCRYCGSKQVSVFHDIRTFGFAVCCKKCGARGPVCITIYEDRGTRKAKMLWNKVEKSVE